MEYRVNHKDEISLKELILVLWNGKLLIVLITVIVLALSAFYTFVIASPAYESSALLNVSFRNKVLTPYGEYEIPFKTMDSYINLMTRPEALKRTLSQLDDISYKQLRNSFAVRKVQDTNMFRMIVSASSPDRAFEIANIHVQSYLNQINHTLSVMIIAEFYNTFSAQIKKDTKELESIEIDLENAYQLLAHTEKAINLENALLSPKEYELFVSEGTLNFGKIKSDKLITQELNPAYLLLLERITDLEIQRSTLEKNIQQNTKLLEELNAEKESLAQAMSKGIKDNSISFSNLVTVISYPEVEAEKVSPRSALNLCAGLALGLMAGVFVTLLKAYLEGTV